MPYSTALNLQPEIGSPRKRLRIAIAGGNRAPERARSWIESAASWLPAELESTLLLLTCELVNNAVRHSPQDRWRGGQHGARYRGLHEVATAPAVFVRIGHGVPPLGAL